ncbi:hypothetical protein MCUN1_000315 [Malassezia cuniculi]|uniref:Prefoldin subunit 4 n=1 Tax=Malassezia cuniculi TaxID=948313 RepID=A0AAF0EV55_9BASI|nr:hypothetical protein MCUN1_000315 [Malassezia cuniculi]
MQMLDEDQNNDVEVTWEDQQQINRFSRLNSQLADAEDELRRRRTEKEELDDLSMELELVDEDDKVLQEDALAQLECDVERTTNQVEMLKRTAAECETEMAQLKRVLYARFGSNINLER